CFYPDEELGGYGVVVPDLPGCVTQGDDLAEAIYMAVDAASGWVLTDLEDGKKPPKASKISDVELEYDDGFVSLIVLDMDTYAEKYGKRSVRKNLTIPAWLNTFAEEQNINFSQVLQNALTDIFQAS
ncbi:MAG: type II toxin-antitoxin system HicB family antitoxin, partial [Clostridia bacterium]|nr:type II toxin-antitoxin system HicB family antitoxin [Clostridia bacterium]